MATDLKPTVAPATSRAADEAVRQTVEGILRDVEARGDAAVRDYSERFDRWSPPAFRLPADVVDELVGAVAPEVRRDIEFAQAQIRTFARGAARRAARRGGRDPAGRHARAQEHPGGERRLLRARRALPDDRVGAHEHPHRQGRRRAARRGVHAADTKDVHTPRRSPRWRLPAPTRSMCSAASRRSRRWRSAPRRLRPSTCSWGPATPTSPKRSASCSAASGSTCLPDRPRSWSSPTTPRRPIWWRPTCWGRRSTVPHRRRSS